MEKFEYFPVTVSDTEEIMSLLISSYIPREPLTMGLHLTDDEIRRQNLRQKVIRWIPMGVSVAARDKATGAIVGVMLSAITTPMDVRPPCDMWKGNEKVREITLHHLDKVFDVYQNHQVQKVIDFCVLTVHHDYGCRGIAKKLIQISEEIAVREGISVVTSIASNKISQHIFTKLGYTVHYTLEIGSLKEEEEGRPLFDLDAMDGSTKTLVISKRLPAGVDAILDPVTRVSPNKI